MNNNRLHGLSGDLRQESNTMRMGIMLTKHVMDELEVISSTLNELGVSVEEAKTCGVLTQREEILFHLREKQKTHPINHSLVFG